MTGMSVPAWAMASTRCCIAVLPPSPPVKPGLGITAVTRCIWFGGIPAHIGEAGLFKEASLMGDVQFVLFPDCPGRDEALVTFATFGYGCLTIFPAFPDRNPHVECQ